MRMIAFVALVTLLTAAACSDFDVVARDAKTSFAETVSRLKTTSDSAGRIDLLLPDAETVSFAAAWKGQTADIRLSLNAKPFIDAGLDTTRLPANYAYDSAAGQLVISFDLGDTDPAPSKAAPYMAVSAPPSINALFAGIVAQYRDRIGYHEEFDHFGLALGDGNMIEWAKDMTRNDKDFVFVLNPKPFLDAGLKTEALSGWVYGTVTVKDEKGNPVKVNKLLKPYNLK